MRMHGYSYHSCDECNHIFSIDKRQESVKHYKKYRKRSLTASKELYEDVLMDKYFQRHKPIEAERAEKILSLTNKDSNVLYVNPQAAIAYKQIAKKVNKIEGVNHDKFWEQCIFDQPSIHRKNLEALKIKRRFNVVVMVDYLEYAYDPYVSLLQAMSFLRPTGKLYLEVPIGNNPIDNYKARTQEFQKTSVRYLAKQIAVDSKLTIDNNIATIVSVFMSCQENILKQENPVSGQ